MRGIFDDAKPVLGCQPIELLHVHRQPREMHRHDGAGTRRNGGRYFIKIDIARIQLDIDEDRFGTHARNDIRARRKAHGRNDDFVPRADPRNFQSHLETGGG